jgi:dihydrofolate reductase
VTVDRRSGPTHPTTIQRRITVVAAYADNRVIGDHGRIPWHLPEDFAHFKATTMGGVLVMGRATYDSIGRPLPGRTTIVVTRQPDWSAEGVLVAHSLEEALDLAAEHAGETFVVGGTQIYEQALPMAALTGVMSVKGRATRVDPANPVSAEELQQLVADSLATYKHLRHLVIVDTIPRLPSGKVLRRTLRDEWAPTLAAGTV